MKARRYKLTEGAALFAAMRQVAERLEKSIARGSLRAAAVTVQVAGKDNIDEATGLAREAVKVQTRAEPGLVSAKVRVAGKHSGVALMLEKGVAEHFIDSDSKVIKIGDHYVSGPVEHPGVEPTYWLSRALDEKMAASIQAAGDYARKRLSKQGLETPDIGVEADDE